MFYPCASKNCDTGLDVFIEVNRETFVTLFNSLIRGIVE